MTVLAEIPQDGERGECLQDDDADHSRGVHPQEKLQVGVGPEQGECTDNDCGEDGLGDPGGRWGFVDGVDVAEFAGQHAF